MSALEEIMDANARVHVLERRLDRARRERDEIIAAALEAGTRQVDIARALGVSRQRLGNLIRSGRLAARATPDE